MKRLVVIATCYLTMIGGFSSCAYAHFPWINADNYSPEPGDSIYITIGWGHRYPLGRLLMKDNLDSLVLINPDGKEEALFPVSDQAFCPETNFSAPGLYIVSAKRKTGFWTKTTEGGKRQSKEGLSNVIKCFRSHMNAKALINVGKGKRLMKNRVGHALEIVPLINPAELRVGDYLPLQVFLNGKPYSDKLYATYMGFSTDKDVFAYTTKTDSQGKGRIRILKPGIWLIKVEHQRPYPDKDVCDVESFISTLTLEVK